MYSFENLVETGSLFSPDWTQTCSPSASASLMFELHGCTSIFNAWENLNAQSSSWHFFILRNGHVSTVACRIEQTQLSRPSYSFSSSMIGHLQVDCSACFSLNARCFEYSLSPCLSLVRLGFRMCNCSFSSCDYK